MLGGSGSDATLQFFVHLPKHTPHPSCCQAFYFQASLRQLCGLFITFYLPAIGGFDLKLPLKGLSPVSPHPEPLSWAGSAIQDLPPASCSAPQDKRHRQGTAAIVHFISPGPPVPEDLTVWTVCPSFPGAGGGAGGRWDNLRDRHAGREAEFRPTPRL